MLALQLLCFALDPVFGLLDLIVLLRLAVDCRHDFGRQFDTEHERVENLDRVLQEVVVMFGIELLHRLGLYQGVRMSAQICLRVIANLVLIALRDIEFLRRMSRDDFARLAADFGSDDRGEVTRTNEFVEHGDGVVEQLIPNTDLRHQTDAVL